MEVQSNKRALSGAVEQSSNKRPKSQTPSSPPPLAPSPSPSSAAASATSQPPQSSPPAAFHYYSSPPLQAYYWHLSPPLQPKTPTQDDRVVSSAQEREQQRRLSHSSIEKRRREKINDKIQQLKLLIPECNPCPDRDPIAAPSFHQPLHKLNILQAAIDYIEQLHRILVDAAENPQERDAETTALLQSPKVVKVIEHAYKTLNVGKANS